MTAANDPKTNRGIKPMTIGAPGAAIHRLIRWPADTPGWEKRPHVKDCHEP